MAAEESGQALVSPPKKRGKRPTRIGVVTSHKRDKTIAVTVSYSVKHPKYGKYIRRRTVLHAHDESNAAATGDKVEIVLCRPLSKTKTWRLMRILTRAPRGGAA
ncbi:MAG: 30S ribosomal protein S17 [Phycisphaerae bacterium]